MDKAGRVLTLFCRLLNRERLNMRNVANEFGKTERSVARDFRTIRDVLSELHESEKLVFDRNDESYYLCRTATPRCSHMDAMAFLKVLCGSRAFCQDEMHRLADVLRSFFPDLSGREFYMAVEDELNGYVEPLHHKSLVKLHWDLTVCVMNRNKLRISYCRHDGRRIERDVLPVQIVFSEFYFYLVAFLYGESYDYPAFFRLDRIEHFEVLGKARRTEKQATFRFGEMRPSVQFMYAGKLTEITFRCKTYAMEAVLDRMADYRVVRETADTMLVTAKAFDEGFLRWALMQGAAVEIVSPKELREKMREKIEEMACLYQADNDDARASVEKLTQDT